MARNVRDEGDETDEADCAPAAEGCAIERVCLVIRPVPAYYIYIICFEIRCDAWNCEDCLPCYCSLQRRLLFVGIGIFMLSRMLILVCGWRFLVFLVKDDGC